MNEEEREQLKQIRERWSKSDIPETLFSAHCKSDIDFLLSMIDSRADPRPYGNQHYPYCARHEGGNYNATLACTCCDYPLVAGTAMRDACVEKVKAMRDEWRREADSREGFQFANDRLKRSAQANAADWIITALESLTLHQVEQEKQP